MEILYFTCIDPFSGEASKFPQLYVRHYKEQKSVVVVNGVRTDTNLGTVDSGEPPAIGVTQDIGLLKEVKRVAKADYDAADTSKESARFKKFREAKEAAAAKYDEVAKAAKKASDKAARDAELAVGEANYKAKKPK